MLLAKCCHDLDILSWNVGRRATRIQSFGSLLHFRADQAPAGATTRCTEGCPAADLCPYDCRKLYLAGSRSGWPVTAITEDLSSQGRLAALKGGPYGRYVYKIDNDVVDHQTVNIEFEGGLTAVLIMQGHSHREERTLRYDGTRATLTGTEGSRMDLHEYPSRKSTKIDVPAGPSGHGGGDFGLVRAFIESVRTSPRPLHQGREALESHLLAHAAEQSRHDGTVIQMEAFRRAAEAHALSLFSRDPG